MPAEVVSKCHLRSARGTHMRAIMIAMLAAAAVGLFSPSAVSAAPVNAAVVGETTSAGRMIHKVRYCCRRYRRRAPYYVYRPGPYYYRPYDPGAETLHQLCHHRRANHKHQAQRARVAPASVKSVADGKQRAPDHGARGKPSE